LAMHRAPNPNASDASSPLLTRQREYSRHYPYAMRLATADVQDSARIDENTVRSSKRTVKGVGLWTVTSLTCTEYGSNGARLQIDLSNDRDSRYPPHTVSCATTPDLLARPVLQCALAPHRPSTLARRFRQQAVNPRQSATSSAHHAPSHFPLRFPAVLASLPSKVNRSTALRIPEAGENRRRWQGEP
jgi:hypothetical protein